MRRPVLVRAVLLALALGILPQSAWGFPPERRRLYAERGANEYLIIPAVASLPGIGVFVGVIASVSNIADTGIDGAGVIAESIDSTDISIQALALREIPLFWDPLTLQYQYAHIRLGNLQTFLPGRNSPNFTIPVTAEFDVQVIRPVLRFWERRLNFLYTLAYLDGFSLDENGNEAPQQRHSASAEALLDFTDHAVNPYRGLRFGYETTLPAPTESPLGRDRGGERTPFSDRELRVERWELAGYLPVLPRLVLVADARFFRAVGREGTGEVVAGGSPPLRGYPANRWRDRFGVFLGTEGRYTLPVNRRVDLLLARGYLEGIELAAFYEVGQVSPKNDSKLFEDLHESYGLGARVVFEAIVLRFDLAFSDEGPQSHLTIDQAF